MAIGRAKAMAMTNAERQKRFKDKRSRKLEPDKKNSSPEKILFNEVRLAKMLNVTDRLIRMLAQDGVLKPEPESRDKDGAKYDIEKNVPLFIEYLKSKHRTPVQFDQEENFNFYLNPGELETTLAGLE
jgi:hypothetical protein